MVELETKVENGALKKNKRTRKDTYNNLEWFFFVPMVSKW